MGYNDRYWVDKNARAKKAKEHTSDMEKRFSDKIKKAVDETVCYGNENVVDTSCENVPKSIVEDIDSVGAIIKYKAGKTAVLNFASFKNPGGMFINGSQAQEECLCHESFLYNVLKEKKDYYDYNNEHKNKALYINRALYTPDVIFEHEGITKVCDVITCAAPNRSTFIKYNSKPEDEKLNYNTLKDRINFIKRIAEMQNAETLILGAFGCGVFAQDAKTVATLFKEAFATSNVKTIIYAVPSGRDDKNYKAFKEVF